MKKIFNFIFKIKRRFNSYKFSVITRNKNRVYCVGNYNLINSNVKVGKNVKIYPNVSFEGEGLIILGDNVKLGTNTIIFSNKNSVVTIGNNTIIAANCYIIDSNHSVEKDNLIQKQPLLSEELKIGEDVWIGANCSIIKGAVVNNGVVIGANSLVNSEIDSYAIAVGTPAKKIKYRGNL